MRVILRQIVVGIVLTTLSPSTHGQLPEPRTDKLFALVIGHNDAEQRSLPALHYADDDAVENALLLAQYHADVTMLAELDAESQRLYPGISSNAPTPEAVERAFRALNARMERVRSEGFRPILYLFYSGHGDVTANHRGYVHLKGGRLSRDQLLRWLAVSNAFANHVIIDACKSYYMVFGRGVGGNRRAVVGALELEEQALTSNTGVMLSTSGDEDSHEWEALQGGVFSHEVRSSLRGAADLDEDGVISYREAAGFAWNANSSIANARFRPSFFAAQPQDPTVSSAGLIHLKVAEHAPRLIFGPGLGGHYFIERANGARLVDFHPGPDQRLELVVSSERPLFLRRSEGEFEASLPALDRISMQDIRWRRRQDVARGAEHVAFLQAFRRPFGSGAMAAFRKEQESIVQSQNSDAAAKVLRNGLLIAAPVLGIVGGAMSVLSVRTQSEATEQTSGYVAAQINERTQTYDRTAAGFYISAGVALATYSIWTLFSSSSDPIYVRSNLFARGAQLQGKF